MTGHQTAWLSSHKKYMVTKFRRAFFGHQCKDLTGPVGYSQKYCSKLFPLQIGVVVLTLRQESAHLQGNGNLDGS